MPERQKIRAFEVAINEVIRETPDSVTLVLEPFDAAIPEYKAGQFLTIDPHQFPALKSFVAYLEHTKGRKEPTRSYSMSSAPHEAKVAITIKEEPFRPGVDLHPPVLSPFLVHAAPVGLRMHVHGFTGPYVLTDDIEQRADHILHVVAGSGSVPNFSMLKDSLRRHTTLRHTFIYSNKTWDDVIFRKQLDELAQQHTGRLNVVHTLTRSEDVSALPGVRRGRITKELLQEVIGDPARTLAYVCGPAITVWERRKALETKTNATPRFLESVIGHLHEVGLPSDRIKREAFG
jgi:3-ketosteroid 9alpha-monooxygenase subunit B